MKKVKNMSMVFDLSIVNPKCLILHFVQIWQHLNSQPYTSLIFKYLARSIFNRPGKI